MTADLHDLLEDAVSDVEPRHALPDIRRRTGRAQRGRRASFGLAVAGLAAAAVAVVAVVTTGGDGAPAPDAANDPDPSTHVAALYFIGDTPQGERLFREFQRVPDSPDFESELAALASPGDPDYRTLVDAALLDDVELRDGRLEIRLSPDATTLAVQQLVFTLDAAAQRPVPYTLVGPDGPAITQGQRDAEALSPIQVSDPAEGAEVGDVLLARGRTSATDVVPWRIDDGSGRAVLRGQAPVTDTDDLLETWETEIDVARLAPGTYTFVASATADTEDTREGTAPPGRTSDTRTIVVQ